MALWKSAGPVVVVEVRDGEDEETRVVIVCMHAPVFRQAPAWDASVMQRSEILSQQETDAYGNNTDAYGDSADAPGVFAHAHGIAAMEEEGSTLEKGRSIVFTSVAVGASLAHLFLLPLLIP